MRYRQENARLAPHARWLIFFGDSRVRNWAPALEIEGWDIVSRGIAGDAAHHMRDGFDADALALKPWAVIIQAGINDIVAAATSGLDSDEAVRRLLRDFGAMLAEAA